MLILLAAVCAFVLTVLFGRIAIPMLRALKAGQSIREIGPKWHNSKAGTPTMGGIMFILASLICTVAFGWKDMLEGEYTHLLVFAFALVYGLIGFADDFIKVKLKRNLGLTAAQKFLLQRRLALIAVRPAGIRRVHGHDRAFRGGGDDVELGHSFTSLECFLSISNL